MRKPIELTEACDYTAPIKKVIYGQPLISNVNKETSEMKNETEQCDKCGITLCDSCSINERMCQDR